MKKKISVVIPTYNEEANVVPLAKAVSEVMERDLSEYDYEILFIDNHSKDNTQALLRGLCENRAAAAHQAASSGNGCECAACLLGLP